MTTRPEALARWAAALLGSAAVLVGATLLAPRVPLEAPLALAVSGTLAFLCVCLEVLVAAACTPSFGRRALLGLPVPLAVLGLVAWGGRSVPSTLAAALVTVALLASGTLTGAVVGRAVQKAGHLLVVAVVSALVDVFSVLHPRGPTAQLVQVETVVSVLLLPWPVIGTDAIVPLLGVGDVTFSALYVLAARQHGLSIRKTLAALGAGFLVTLAVVIATGTGVPALPFLGLAMLVAHPEARRLPPEDRRTAGVGLSILVALFVALFALRMKSAESGGETGESDAVERDAQAER